VQYSINLKKPNLTCFSFSNTYVYSQVLRDALDGLPLPDEEPVGHDVRPPTNDDRDTYPMEEEEQLDNDVRPPTPVTLPPRVPAPVVSPDRKKEEEGADAIMNDNGTGTGAADVPPLPRSRTSTGESLGSVWEYLRHVSDDDDGDDDDFDDDFDNDDKEPRTKSGDDPCTNEDEQQENLAVIAARKINPAELDLELQGLGFDFADDLSEYDARVFYSEFS